MQSQQSFGNVHHSALAANLPQQPQPGSSLANANSSGNDHSSTSAGARRLGGPGPGGIAFVAPSTSNAPGAWNNGPGQQMSHRSMQPPVQPGGMMNHNQGGGGHGGGTPFPILAGSSASSSTTTASASGMSHHTQHQAQQQQQQVAAVQRHQAAQAQQARQQQQAHAQAQAQQQHQYDSHDMSILRPQPIRNYALLSIPPRYTNKRNPQSEKERMQTWHDYPMEKKNLKKNELGPPGVFPQEPSQDEDNLSPEHIKKGFQPSVLPCELESALSKFSKPQVQEDVLNRTAAFIEGVRGARNDSGTVNLDKKKIRDIGFQPPAKSSNKSQKWSQWFYELVKGKSYSHLAKKIPLLRTTDEYLDIVFENRLPIIQAVWFLKVSSVGATVINTQKSKKQCDVGDHSVVFVKYLKDILYKLDEDPLGARQKWDYFVPIIRQCFMDGLVDRMEFLLELCDAMLEQHQRCTIERNLGFRLLTSFISLFIRDITKNIFVARRFMCLIGDRLTAFFEEYEKRWHARHPPQTGAKDKDPSTAPSTPTSSSMALATIHQGKTQQPGEPTPPHHLTGTQAMAELLACPSIRPIIMTLFGMTAAIVIDCPYAVVWTSLERGSTLPPAVVGTPLNRFPIDPMDIPMLIDESTTFTRGFKKSIVAALTKIHERSMHIDRRFMSAEDSKKSDYQIAVRAAIFIIELLDTADFCREESLIVLYARVFGRTKEIEPFEGELRVQLHCLLNWAITAHREGSHRALLVTRLLQMYVTERRTALFLGQPFVRFMTSFLEDEGPKPKSKYFRREFRNLMLLLVELQRVGLFGHEEYGQLLIRYFNVFGEPLLPKLRAKATGKDKEPSAAPDPTPTQPAVISFIPTAKPAPVDPSPPTDQTSLKEEDEAPRIFTDDKIEMNVHERIFLHLPIEQTNANTSAINQRSTILYGVSDDRDTVRIQMKRFAADVVKAWQKNATKFYVRVKEVRRRSNVSLLTKLLNEFLTFTFYDQRVIAGICCDEYEKMLKNFLQDEEKVLPSMECFDLLIVMMEAAQSIYSLLDYFLQIIHIILDCDLILCKGHTDFIPSFFTTQQAFVIASFLADHYKYFLLYPQAVALSNGIYRLVEKEMHVEGWPISAWSRTVAGFLIQVKYDLKSCSGFTFKALDCKRLLPDNGVPVVPPRMNLNPKLFMDMLREPKRCFCYHDYKVRLPSIDDSRSRMSFVVNAFTCVKEIGNNYEILSELANMCGHVSAQKPMSSEWLFVIHLLVTPHSARYDESGVPKHINVMDYSMHYAYSTFISLLASKFCFSAHSLLFLLCKEAFYVHTNNLYLQRCDAKISLALQICANILTASDEPVHLNKKIFDMSTCVRPPFRNVDFRSLRILHIRECSFIMFLVVELIYDFMRTIKKDTDLYSNALHILMAITDQEWVVERFHEVSASERDITPLFHKNLPAILTTDSPFPEVWLMQRLIRVATKRRTEREFKIEMLNYVSTKKQPHPFEKLLTPMSLWNFKALHYDFKSLGLTTTMELLTTPDQLPRVCRELLITGLKEKRDIKSVDDFVCNDVDMYSLLPEFIDHLPADTYNTTGAAKPAKGIFLEHVLDDLFQVYKPDDDTRYERWKELSELLCYHPFQNLVITLTTGCDKTLESGLSALLRQASLSIAVLRENPERACSDDYIKQRECLLHKLTLVERILELSTSPNDQVHEYFAMVYEVLYFGLITPERDGEAFNSAMDILVLGVLASFIGPGLPQPPNPSGGASGTDAGCKVRYPEYYRLVRAMINRTSEEPLKPSLSFLQQLLPINRPLCELPAYIDTFGLNPSPQRQSVKYTPGCPRSVKAIRVDQGSEPEQKKVLRLIYHTHQNDFFHPGTFGLGSSKNKLEAVAVGPPGYSEPKKDPSKARSIPGRQQQHGHGLQGLQMPSGFRPMHPGHGPGPGMMHPPGSVGGPSSGLVGPGGSMMGPPMSQMQQAQFQQQQLQMQMQQKQQQLQREQQQRQQQFTSPMYHPPPTYNQALGQQNQQQQQNAGPVPFSGPGPGSSMQPPPPYGFDGGMRGLPGQGPGPGLRPPMQPMNKNIPGPMMPPGPPGDQQFNSGLPPGMQRNARPPTMVQGGLSTVQERMAPGLPSNAVGGSGRMQEFPQQRGPQQMQQLPAQASTSAAAVNLLQQQPQQRQSPTKTSGASRRKSNTGTGPTAKRPKLEPLDVKPPFMAPPAGLPQNYGPPRAQNWQQGSMQPPNMPPGFNSGPPGGGGGMMRGPRPGQGPVPGQSGDGMPRFSMPSSSGGGNQGPRLPGASDGRGAPQLTADGELKAKLKAAITQRSAAAAQHQSTTAAAAAAANQMAQEQQMMHSREQQMMMFRQQQEEQRRQMARDVQQRARGSFNPRMPM